MDDQPPAWQRVEQLVTQLRDRVERRREAGAYPPGLEAELDEHFQRIAVHRVEPELDELKIRLGALDAHMGFTPSRIPSGSRVVGGTAIHRSVSRLVARQTQGVLEQVMEFADAVRDVLRSTVAAVEDPYSHAHADLVGQVDQVLERMSHFERGQIDASVAQGTLHELRRRVEELETAELERRLEVLEVAEQRRTFRPWFSNERFEQEFRGSHEDLLERYRDLASHLHGLGPVLEIGCGRGEFLELLGAGGVSASGVELDVDLVKLACDKGLDVVAGNGLVALADADDASLGGVVLIQVVEHLTAQEVVELVAMAASKLRPGGKMIVETVNPQSLYVFARAFYLDPTHAQPVHPGYLSFLVREAGFDDVFIEWRSPPPEDERLVELSPRSAEAMRENVHRLNELLFAPQDYALVATR
ncbi:MAG: class I SAM-dependent methyltransferase [Acidimicrobiales bacterium]